MTCFDFLYPSTSLLNYAIRHLDKLFFVKAKIFRFVSITCILSSFFRLPLNFSLNFVLKKFEKDFYEGLTQKQYLYLYVHVACACLAWAAVMISVYSKRTSNRIKWKPSYLPQQNSTKMPQISKMYIVRASSTKHITLLWESRK